MRAAILLVAALASTACDHKADLDTLIKGQVASARAARLQRMLKQPIGFDSTAPIARWIMPNDLAEISGIAVTKDGRLLAHDDERAQVFEIDFRRGILVKRFMLGKKATKGDFEGIAIADTTIYMIRSSGKIYAFPEGANDARVNYTIYDPGLSKECEFEGIAFDSAANTLLLACKRVLVEGHDNELVIYRWPVGADSAHVTRTAAPLDSVLSANTWKKFRPSDITVDPATGNYIIISSQDNALVVITPSMQYVTARPLPPGHHQAEGTAMTRDGILLISDEAGGKTPLLTLYRWR